MHNDFNDPDLRNEARALAVRREPPSSGGARNFKPERLRGLYVDGELESRRLFERQVGGLRAFENAVDKGRHASEVLVEIRAVRHQATIVNKKVKFVDGRQSMRRGVF